MSVLNIREAVPEHRFSRFELISWWDQNRLRNARVLVIGAGALGNEIVKNCALLGIGNLVVADMDRIENSNLTRSPLFRESDNGKYKAEIACRSARELYPQIRAQPFIGNVVHDLGLGVYFWADVILGGLDNREARVAINSAALFAGKPWIDGAIEVLDGVARVFAPGPGPCYECTMNATDWKMLENRRSCALLTRTQLNEGKVPTTPTTASIISAVQMQEAIKLLHGMETLSGKGFVYHGLSAESYTVAYTRKPDCAAHEPHQDLRRLKAGVADMRVSDLLKIARAELGEGTVLQLGRDILTALNCPACGTSEPVFRSLGKTTEAEGKCPQCGQMRAPELTHTLGLEPAPIDNMTFEQIGTPRFDVVTARKGERSISYLFSGDAQAVLGEAWRESDVGKEIRV
ncbi:MAG TPA: ThiF family adenylyltransferase [Planctomycetota bacterium]|nr:ThiF family adenylyltransferase [Planctomycetota bacterium]